MIKRFPKSPSTHTTRVNAGWISYVGLNTLDTFWHCSFSFVERWAQPINLSWNTHIKNSPASGCTGFGGQSASSVSSSQWNVLSHRWDIGMHRLISQENSCELHSENWFRTFMWVKMAWTNFLCLFCMKRNWQILLLVHLANLANCRRFCKFVLWSRWNWLVEDPIKIIAQN